MLIVIPAVVEHELPTDFVGQAIDAGTVVVHGLHRRKEILERALAAVGWATPDATAGPPAQLHLADDFLALGLAYLLTELLTRRMRYMSNLDEKLFKDTVVSAASAAVAGDEEAAQRHIARCCELLYESRAHYYPVDTYLLDLALLAPTTLGEALRRELTKTLPINLLASGDVLEAMAEREPASLAIVRERLAAKSLSLIGGEYREVELPLLSHEAILAELEAGHRTYKKHLGVQPEVFGRRRAGLTPALPQILRGLGYKGALHFTLDDGRFPEASRSKTLWEGSNATAIDAVGRVPLDAGDAASILSLPEKLGESMDHDFVSMISLAHWPGLASEYFEDLRRISKYSPVLG
jgi:alpha-mannosidase